jgi:hypothetical protein
MEEYGADKGKLKGEIEFINQHGEMKVRVNNEQAEKIVAIMAENLVETAKQTAALMTAEVLGQSAGVEMIEG